MFELFCLVLEYRDRYPRLSSTQTKSPRSQSLYQCMKIYLHKYWLTGKLTLHLGGVIGVYYKPQNRWKKSSKTTKPQKNDKKPKTACKTVETEKFSHPSYQNHNRSDTELTNGAKRGFAAMRDRWGRKVPLRLKRNQNPNRKNRKTTSNTKSENLLVVLTKTDNQMLKNRQSANRNEYQTRKVF